MSNSDFQEEPSDTESGSSEDNSGSEEDVGSWISWFCSLKGNEFFCEVDEDYIQDDFNLSGLSSQVKHWQLQRLSVILQPAKLTYPTQRKPAKRQEGEPSVRGPAVRLCSHTDI